MAVQTTWLSIPTEGHAHMIDVTPDAQAVVSGSDMRSGILTLFVPGSTGGLTTIEFEPGAVSDFQRMFDEIVSPDREYRHHLQWGDDNGHSHVRAALLGPGLTVPFADGKLTLGTWQQIILCDFDTSGRDRKLVAQLMGE